MGVNAGSVVIRIGKVQFCVTGRKDAKPAFYYLPKF